MRNLIMAAGFGVVVGVCAGYLMLTSGEVGAPSVSSQSVRDVLYWVAPMDPNYRRDKPGKSPMGMDLVPVYADDTQVDGEPSVSIDPAMINNLGVKTSPVIRGGIARNIETVGFVAVDETRTAHVHVRVSGWVEKLSRKALGERVSAGELLFELYAPELVNAQAEFIQAQKIGNGALLKAAGGRLIALGMTDKQVEALAETGTVSERIAVHAPQDGVIMSLSIGEGMYVTPGKTIFALADLSNIWVMAEVFEAQAPWVKMGQAAIMTLPFVPGEQWNGIVDHIYPTVDPKSRTVQVRLAIDNKDRRLKPNMYGSVSLAGSTKPGALSVPEESVIRDGRTNRAIVALGDGRFRPAAIEIGLESDGRVEILAGLNEGELVVTSGQFLIDSEASLNATMLRLLPDSHHDADGKSAGKPSIHSIVGVINGFNDDGTVNLTHGPIETLGMMGMTMNFRVAPSFQLNRFEIGRTLRFKVVQTEDGWLEVVDAEPAVGGEPDQ